MLQSLKMEKCAFSNSIHTVAIRAVMLPMLGETEEAPGLLAGAKFWQED